MNDRAQRSGNGSSPEQAVWVESMAEEYIILRRLDLEVKSQSLHQLPEGTYDVFETVETRTGQPRTIWFDITDCYVGDEFAAFVDGIVKGDDEPAA